MTRTLLEHVFAGYQIQQWADNNSVRIIRVAFSRKGAVVFAMPRA